MEKILIVDDENDIAELISDILEDEGYETVIANDGNEAIAKFNSENPALILLDIMLPGDDGMVLLKKLKSSSKTKDIPGRT